MTQGCHTVIVSTGYDSALFDWFETGAEVERLWCWVVGLEADLDAFCACLCEKVDSSGEKVAGESSSLVVVFDAHGFGEAGMVTVMSVCRMCPRQQPCARWRRHQRYRQTRTLQQPFRIAHSNLHLSLSVENNPAFAVVKSARS
jgi:hypothetical protein